MTIPTCSRFGLCKLSRILAGTHSFWDCRTVLFHWLTEVKRPPFLRARNLKQRTKVSGSLALQFQHRGTVSNARLVGHLPTSASRTRPWLAGEWGCRSRRLSTALEIPDTRRRPWERRLASRKLDLAGGAPVRLWARSPQAPGDPGFFETRSLRRRPGAPQGKLLLAHTRGTSWASCTGQLQANRIRTEQRAPGNEVLLEGLHGPGRILHEEWASSSAESGCLRETSGPNHQLTLRLVSHLPRK